MDDRGMDRMMRAAESGARHITDTAQEAASRAGSYAQAGMGRALDLAEDAGDQMERLTGRPLEAWASDVRRLVQSYPLQAIAITIGVGYLLGKILRRGS
jgi:ElaB/YqjD/DUF883 family membrane-anchored ribosome-binding protein